MVDLIRQPSEICGNRLLDALTKRSKIRVLGQSVSVNYRICGSGVKFVSQHKP